MRNIKDMSAAVYIPGEYNAAIARTTRIMGGKFGGTTNVKAEGTWLDDNGKVISEDITIIRSWYAAKDYLFATAFIIDLAVELRKECKQDCIAIEVEGEMMLI